MKKTSLLLLFAFLLFLGRFPLFSQHPYFAWSNAEKLSELYQKSPYVVAFDSLVTKVSETGLSVVERKTLYQVLSSEGTSKLSTLILDYDPLSAEIVVLDMFIVRKNGEKEPFYNPQVYDYAAPARMIYWGARQKMAEPGRLEVGDMVFIHYRRKGFTYALLADSEDERFIPPMRGHFYDIVEFFDSYPIHYKSYTVILPKEKTFLYKTYNADFDVDIKEDGTFRKAHFVLKSIMPIEKESRRVNDSDIAPKVIVTTTERWEDKSKWFYGVNEDFGSFNSTPQIEHKVKEILNGAVDELDSISRLTRWVADEIRYSGISMGEGEGYTLHTGEMTFTDRCGVCKDKAGLLVTMLRSAGFKSYAAMTMAGSRIENIPADQFNHSVTVVQRFDGTYMLLDPTWVPFVRELWSSREQQQNYLLGLPDGDILRETPISSAENHFLKINNALKIDRKGNASGVLTLIAEGQSDATVRSIFTRALSTVWEWNVKKQLLQYFPEAIISKVEFSDPYRYWEQPVRITVFYSIPAYAVGNKKSIIVKTLTGSGVFSYAQMYSGFSANSPERKYPFVGSCSQLVEIEESFEFPKSIRNLQNIVQNQSFDGEFVAFESCLNVHGNKLTVNIKERFNQRVYPADAWKEFYQLFQARKQYNNPILIQF